MTNLAMLSLLLIIDYLTIEGTKLNHKTSIPIKIQRYFLKLLDKFKL